jgi:hypothetical protein
MVTKGLEASGSIPGAGKDKGSSTTGPGGAGGGLGNSAGMMASQFGVIKDVLEQSIRRARVKVLWKEGALDHHVEVMEYLTDPRRVDQAIQMPMGLPGGNPPPGNPPPGNPPPGNPPPGNPINLRAR